MYLYFDILRSLDVLLHVFINHSTKIYNMGNKKGRKNVRQTWVLSTQTSIIKTSYASLYKPTISLCLAPNTRTNSLYVWTYLPINSILFLILILLKLRSSRVPLIRLGVIYMFSKVVLTYLSCFKDKILLFEEAQKTVAHYLNVLRQETKC